MNSITTLQDARRERATHEDTLVARDAARDAARRETDAKRRAQFFVPATLHPAIGVFTKATGVTFYAYLHGSSQPITKGTVDELTAKLLVLDALAAQRSADACARIRNGQ